MTWTTVHDEVDIAQLHRLAAERGLGPRGIDARDVLGSGRTLTIRLTDGRSWTYRTTDDGLTVAEGDTGTPPAIELDAEALGDVMTEGWSMFGLMYGSRLEVHGELDHVAAWEPALQCVWFDRPLWRAGAVDAAVPASHRWADAVDHPDTLARELNDMGFVHLTGVFTAAEIDAMRQEVERQVVAATPDDGRSWWATTGAGEEVCCRVTYLNDRSTLFADLAHDERLAALAALGGDDLVATPDHGDGVSVIVKNPDLASGLGDLPWHRDCGMGGHRLLCPGLNIGIQLDAASEAAGRLHFLAGSSHTAGGQPAAGDAASVVAVDTEPGDVTVHFGHTLHAAPPPTGSGPGRRTVYVSFHRPGYTSVVPAGQGYNDVLFAHGDGRIRPPDERP